LSRRLPSPADGAVAIPPNPMADSTRSSAEQLTRHDAAATGIKPPFHRISDARHPGAVCPGVDKEPVFVCPVKGRTFDPLLQRRRPRSW
jgi:hypothetical protein